MISVKEMNDEITRYCRDVAKRCNNCVVKQMKQEGVLSTCDEEDMSDAEIIAAYERIMAELSPDFEESDVPIEELLF